jgi:hypothetical protein
VLAVGEGEAEGGLLRYSRMLMRENRDTNIIVRQAQGKGALGVIRYAIAQQATADFDLTLALLDTDANWNQNVAALARKHGIQVVPCDPCLEAVLCEVASGTRLQQSTQAHKTAFEKRFGWPAHDDRMRGWYETQWPTLAAMRANVAPIFELTTLLDHLCP